MKRKSYAATATASVILLTGCAHAVNPDIVNVGKYQFLMPKGYGKTDTDNGATKDIVTITDNADGQPLRISVNNNREVQVPTDSTNTSYKLVSQKEWCNWEYNLFMKKYVNDKNKKVTQTTWTYNGSETCAVVGYGRPTSTTGPNPNYSIPKELTTYASMTKVDDAHYIGVTSGHQGLNKTFGVEKNLIKKLVDEVR